MNCKNCEYWTGNMCADPLEFVNKNGEYCCRYAEGAEPIRHCCDNVIFDIDGTLADVDDLLRYWDADPEEFYKRVGEAKVIEKIEKFYKMLLWADLHTLIIYTARPEKTRIATDKWLEENGIFYENLLMAKDNDNRHDVDIKLEMLRENDLTPD